MMVEVGAAATLLVSGGPNNSVIIKLTGRPITLGRRQDNDVVIDETTVSCRHSLILDTPGGFLLRDLNTNNGTFISGTHRTRLCLSVVMARGFCGLSARVDQTSAPP